MDGGVLADLVVPAGARTEALLGPGAVGAEPQRLSDQQAGCRAQGHRAAELIHVQLGVGQPGALMRIRANAFGHRRAVADVPPLP
jgi:hypothetical protein